MFSVRVILQWGCGNGGHGIRAMRNRSPCLAQEWGGYLEPPVRKSVLTVFFPAAYSVECSESSHGRVPWAGENGGEPWECPMQIDEYPILVEQLCPGLYIRIEGAGQSVPFPPKGMLLKTDADVARIAAMGLPHVLCVPDKSDRLPISLEEIDNLRSTRQRGPWTASRTPLADTLSRLKKETIEKNKDRLERYNVCESQYQQALEVVVETIKRVNAPSAEVLEAAQQVVGPMADAFLSDFDVLVHVMTARGGEDARYSHALNVAVLSIMLASELGLTRGEVMEVGLGALFHDVGKGLAPIQRFTKGNMVSMNKVLKEYYMDHPGIGARLLAAVPDFPPASQMIVLQHHENIDGTGFPAHLAGLAIAMGARLVAVSDMYDKLCNTKDKNGVNARTPHEAMKGLYKHRGVFDPRAVTQFIRKLGVYPPGSLVQLSNGMQGMVVSANMSDSMRPNVKVYHPDIPRREALVIDLGIETELAVQQALKPTGIAPEVLRYLSFGKQIAYYVDATPHA